jgi:hypothetical protein
VVTRRTARTAADTGTTVKPLRARAPQSQHGAGVELADPGLGDAEAPADLGEGEVLEVVEDEHDPVPLGEVRYGPLELPPVVLADPDDVTSVGCAGWPGQDA